MSERPIDVARRVIRRAFERVHQAIDAEHSRRLREELKFRGRVESLESRVALSHVLPHHHAAHPVHRVAITHAQPVPSSGAVFHAEDFMSSGSKPVPPGQKPTYAPEWINLGGVLRVIAGGVPFVPGGPINPPIVAKPVPAKPVPVPVKPPVVPH